MKKILLFICILFCSIFVCSCKDEEDPNNENITYVEEGATKVNIYTRTFEEWHIAWLESIINEFNKDLNDGIQVDAKFYTNDTYADALTVARENGKTPDIFISTYGDLFTNVKNNFCEPLDSYLSTSAKEDFFENSLDMVSYYDNIYGIPWNLEPGSLLFYRKDMLETAGISKIPTTWQELYDACEKIKTTIKRGQYCLGMPLGTTECSWVSYGLQMNTTGGLALDDTWGECLINSEGYQKLAELFYNIYINDYAPTAGLTDEAYTDIIEALCDGKLAMTFAGSWSIARIYEYTENDLEMVNKIGVAPIPTIDGNQDKATSSNGGYCYCISSQSRNKDFAAKFINFMFTESAERSAKYFIAAYNSKSPASKSIKQYLDANPTTVPLEWVSIVNDVASKGFPEATYPWDIASEVGGIFATMELNCKTDSFAALYSKALLGAQANIATIMSRKTYSKNPKYITE